MPFPFHIDILDVMLKGILIGILASAPMGPVGVLCVQRTLKKGRWYGFVTGVGASISDIIYALITGYGMSFVMDLITNPTNKFWLQIIGSIVLLIFGIYCFRNNPTKNMHQSGNNKGSYWHNGKYVGMEDNNQDLHQEDDAHIWGSTEIIRQATPTEQGILRHHCAVDGCKGYYEEFFDYVAPAEPVTPAPTDPDTPDVRGTSDSTPGTPAQGTPADAATADAVPGAATVEEVSVTPSGAQTVTAAALPKTGVNWLAAVGSAISGMVLLAAGLFLNRKESKH